MEAFEGDPINPSDPRPRTVEDCALFCSETTMCHSFTFDSNNNKCFGQTGSSLRNKTTSTVSPTSGLCPKVKSLQGSAAGLVPKPAPLKCSPSGELCQFPFRLHGELHWDCVGTNDSRKVCSVRADSREMQDFTDLSSFVPCGDCSECSQSGFPYYGFNLENNAGGDSYKPLESDNECQLLCQLTDNCNFYDYDNSTKE